MIKLQVEHKVLHVLQVTHVELVITQVDNYVKMTLTSQLMNGISRVLQKLLKYFNGTLVSTSFVLPSAGVFPVTFNLNLND